MLKTLKTQALSTARQTGILSATRESAWRGRRLLILGYHGISNADEHLWDGELYMRPETLRTRFTTLRDGGYQVLQLDDALRRMQSATLPPRAVALTFDDGAFDFLSQAVPLLREFGFPATVHLTTYYCEPRRPVFPTMLQYLLWRARDQVLDMEGLAIDSEPAPLATLEQRTAAFHRIFAACLACNAGGPAKDAILTESAKRLRLDYATILEQRLLQLMTPEGVASLPRDLVDVQLHTLRHRAAVGNDVLCGSRIAIIECVDVATIDRYEPRLRTRARGMVERCVRVPPATSRRGGSDDLSRCRNR